MMVTSHSEYLKLKSVYIKSVQNAFCSKIKINEQWQELNYLEKPDFDLAMQEYIAFEKLLNDSNIELLYFPQDSKVKIDSIYCRDSSIVTDFGMIICNMGKAGRIYEPQSHLEAYKNSNIPILGIIEAPGTLEGGDVAWLNEETLVVGYSYRTNEAGISQLKSFLEPKGIEVIVAELPHYKGRKDVFHLMSILSPVDEDLAIVYSPLMPIKLRNELLNRGFKFVEVPDEEFESMGCNVLATAPRECIMVEGNSITKKLLEDAGCKVTTYKGQEISVKGGGGPTCLTRPLLRVL